MSLATSNRDGGRTNEAGHLRSVTKGFLGQVLNGLSVSQRGAGANMSVDVAIGDAIIQRSDNTYGHPAWNDAVLNQAIAASDGSNPRRDIIVMYVDYNQTPSTGVANNTNGVVKITSVSGTAAGSPVDPSNATIQSAVGSGNPWIKLARVRVAAGATSISNSVIDDLRQLATGASQGGWIYDSVYSWVYASASTFTIAGVDARAQLPIGTKLRIMQGGSVKYFIVTNATFSTNTTITVDGKGTYTLANQPIDAPAYSYLVQPRGYPFPGVTSSNIDFTSAIWGEELGRVEAGSVTSSLTVAIPAKKYLYIMLYAIPSGGTLNVGIRFNGDSGNNYAERGATNGAADATATNLPQINTKTAIDAHPQLTTGEFRNIANQEKLGIMHSVIRNSLGAAPDRKEGVYKWSNTSVQITSVTAIATGGTGNMAAGSTLIVLGHD